MCAQWVCLAPCWCSSMAGVGKEAAARRIPLLGFRSFVANAVLHLSRSTTGISRMGGGRGFSHLSVHRWTMSRRPFGLSFRMPENGTSTNIASALRGGAGACSALIVALKDDNDLGVVAVGTRYPQTSLDPEEMRRWIPNISYGAEAFGYSSFDEWLAHRSDVLRWIEHYSPILLLKKCRSDRVPKFFMDSYSLEKEGALPKDPTHAGMFREKFRETCRALGYEARDFVGDDYYDALLECISGGREHLQRVKRTGGNAIIGQKEERTK